MTRHSLVIFLRYLLLAAGCTLAVWLGAFDSLENKVLDQRFRLRGRAPISPDLVLVDISTDAAAEFGPWPLPRYIHGMFIDAATNLGVHSVIYDVLFSRPSEPRSDRLLLDMSSVAQNVYYPLWFSPYDESFKPDSAEGQGIARHSLPLRAEDSSTPSLRGLLSLPLPGLDSSARGMGFVNVLHDRDGIVRRTQMRLRCANRAYQQLVIPAWENRSGRTVDRSLLDPDGNLVINWPGRWQDFPHYSFREILVSYKQVMDGVDPVLPLDSLRSLKGKILLVGHVDPASQEFIATPFEPRLPTTGLQFAILNTLLTDSAIRILSRWQEIGLVLGFLLVSMIFLRQEMLSWQIGIAVLFGGYLILGQWLFVRHHLLLPAVSVGVSLGLLVALYDIAKFRAERKTREQMKSIFAKYVTREVMDQLLERPELAQLGGRKEIVTILFSDIRGFTSLSETLEPQDVVGQLNEYLSTMTAIIFAEHGIIDKFVGDGIMVYFGAPVYPQEHAWRAIKVAIQMQNGMETLRAKWQSEGKPDIQIGIGVNTGSVIMGNIGSSQYMDFTLIGDAVNLSSRLCTVAAAGEILISDSTYREVGDRVVVAKSSETRLKGRSQPVRVHSIQVTP